MFNQLDTMVVEGEELSSILIKVLPLQYLKPFFLEPKTLSEASKELKVEMSSYYYWLKKFQRLGLLVVAYEKKRAGSSVKYYCTPAKRFVLKLDNNNYSLRKYFEAANASYCADSISNQLASLASIDKDLAIVCSIDKQGEIKSVLTAVSKNQEPVPLITQVMQPDMPAIITIWQEMQLSFQDAKELQSRLYELALEFREKIEPGQSRYMVQLSLVPDSQ